jgi:hypothetical protein
MAVRDWGTAALTASGPAAQPGHFGRGAGLVDEGQALGVEVRLSVEPGASPGRDVGPLLLARVRCFFLGWQSSLACFLFEIGKVGAWVPAEPGAQGSCLASWRELAAEVTPLLSADLAKDARCGWMQPCRSCRDQPDLAAQHGGWRGASASRCAAFVVALGCEQLLEGVVGARHVRDGVAVEQSGSVAASDLAEVVHGLRQAAGARMMAGHGGQQAIPAPPHLGGVLSLVVAQDVGGLMHPGIDARDVRPEGGGAFQALADQSAQPRERRRSAPFSATRSRLSATAWRRLLSFRPEAASGAWPSSVMALRTAAQ